MAMTRWIIESHTHLISDDEYGEYIILELSDMPRPSKIRYIRITEAEIPYIPANITSDMNQPTLRIGGSDYTITIEPGYYSGLELLNELSSKFNAALTAAATTYSISFTYYPNKDRVVITAQDTSGPTPTAFTIYNEVPPLVRTSPLLTELLGFDTSPIFGDGTGGEPVGTATATGPLNVVQDRYILITCDEAKGYNSVYSVHKAGVEDWKDGIVAKIQIPPDVDHGTILAYSNPNAPWIPLSKELDPNNPALTFRLSRNRYRTFGQPKVMWEMTLMFC